MDVEVAAIHEAGHSVMQWFVGWEPKDVQMTVVGSNATNVTAECSCPGLESKSTVRKRLLVLLAGNAATLERWPESNNNWGDWLDILRAIQLHFRRPDVAKWFNGDGMTLRDTEANALIQTARIKSEEMVANLLIRHAISKVGNAFASAGPGPDGMTRLSGVVIVAICEAEIGNEFRNTNPWTDWLAGN